MNYQCRYCGRRFVNLSNITTCPNCGDENPELKQDFNSSLMNPVTIDPSATFDVSPYTAPYDSGPCIDFGGGEFGCGGGGD